MMTTGTFVRLWCALLSVALLGSVVAHADDDAARGRHQRLFIVPTPGEVTIDGRLDDWDLSGQVFMYPVAETRDVRGAHLAMMYDDEALYVSGEVRDTTPMMNRHAPEVNAMRAWNADACQIRMVLDPAQGYPVRDSQYDPDLENDQIVHLLLWHYTDRAEPNLQIVRTMAKEPMDEGWDDGVVPRDRFEAAYREHEDGAGYTFEYRLPWSTLGATNPPTAGDLVAGTVQVNWSRADGLSTMGPDGWAYDVMRRPGFPWQSTESWGRFLFSTRNDLPRSITAQETDVQRPEPLSFEYDLPRDGHTTVTLYDETGHVRRHLVVQASREAGRNVESWDGLDNTGEPLEPGDYTWRGLVSDPITAEFILSVHNSGNPPYKTDDNTGGWGGDHGNPRDVAIVDDAVVLAWNVAEAGFGLIRTDLDGHKQWGTQHPADHVASDGERFFKAGGRGALRHAGVRVFDLADSRPLNFGRGQPTAEMPFDADNDTPPVTGLAHHDGRLYVAYAQRDVVAVNDAHTGELLATWPVASPQRIAVTPGGRVLVVSGGTVLEVSEGETRVFADAHLDAPTGIAVDESGRVYLANGGALQHVRVFSAEGEHLASIGKEGGRPRVGRYEADGMLEPGGLAVDRRGHLWVAETLNSPKRISVWDTDTGELVDEFFGASAYSPAVAMDPTRPDEVFCHNVIWKVDLDERTHRPYSTIWRGEGPNVVRPPHPGFHGRMRVLTADNGRQFAWGRHRGGGPILMKRDGDIFKPIAGAFSTYDQSTHEAMPLLAELHDEAPGVYLWQDANDNQTIEREEMTRTTLAPRHPRRLAGWVGADMSLWMVGGHVFEPVRFDGGRPIYDFDDPQSMPYHGFRVGPQSEVAPDPDRDGYYTLFPRDEDGVGYGRWSSDGTLLWGYDDVVPWFEAISLPPPRPGMMWGPSSLLDFAGEFTGVSSYFGTFHILTSDGIYVAMIGEPLTGSGPTSIQAETFNGQLVQPQGLNGRTFLLTGDQDGRILELHGLDTIRRLDGGTYTLGVEKAQLAAEAHADYQRQIAASQVPVIVRQRDVLPYAEPIERRLSDRQGFAARLAYDQQHLYVRMGVTAPHGLTNAVSDTQFVFTGGNAIDIQLATDPDADAERTGPAPGDVRLVVTRHDDQPLAVLYRPTVPEFDGEPIVFHSPTGTETFDRIEEVSDHIGLEYEPTDTGFVAIVSIPLELLDWTPEPTSLVRMDVGYIFGNATGIDATRRLYWSNNAFSANVVDDVPNESRLEPQHWGEVLVE